MPKRAQLVTLTSDFGRSDPYVGVVHGVFLGIDPDLHLIDLTHDVPPQAIEAGAFALYTASTAFPDGTVHWAVVDPGVGTARRGIIVQTSRAWFVGPDNGIFSFVLEREEMVGCWVLDHPDYGRRPVSATFHGRDIFAPAAAMLSSGREPDHLGSRTAIPLVRLSPLESATGPGPVINGRVVWIDHFGNVITTLPSRRLQEDHWTAVRAGSWLAPIAPTYGDALGLPLVAIPGSSGFLEIATPNGSAARATGITIGQQVTLERD